MEPITSTIISAIAVNYFTHLTAPTVEKFFRKALELAPTLEEKIQNASTTETVESVLDEASKVIEAAAGTGTIDISGYKIIIEAIKGIRFDHEKGIVNLNGAILSAPKIVTGSTASNATGQTLITDTEMNTGGTRISVGKGAFIKISGNASIRQN